VLVGTTATAGGVCMVVLLQELESRVTPLHAEYWECLLTLADHELEAQR